MPRRRYPWSEIATMAREAKDHAWRLHPSLVAVDRHLLRHAQRRVRAFRPTPQGRYEFSPRNIGVDQYGRSIFDLFICYIPEGQDQ